MNTIRIATLNINGVSALTRIAMLADFLRRWELDVLLVQEITQPVIHDIVGYNTYYNIGTSRRGTAVIARESLRLTNVNRLPSGRAMSVRVRDICIINIYAPSGTARRQEREHFYASELPPLLTDSAQHIILGGGLQLYTGTGRGDWDGELQPSPRDADQGTSAEGRVERIGGLPRVYALLGRGSDPDRPHLCNTEPAHKENRGGDHRSRVHGPSSGMLTTRGGCASGEKRQRSLETGGLPPNRQRDYGPVAGNIRAAKTAKKFISPCTYVVG